MRCPEIRHILPSQIIKGPMTPVSSKPPTTRLRSSWYLSSTRLGHNNKMKAEAICAKAAHLSPHQCHSGGFSSLGSPIGRINTRPIVLSCDLIIDNYTADTQGGPLSTS